MLRLFFLFFKKRLGWILAMILLCVGMNFILNADLGTEKPTIASLEKVKLVLAYESADGNLLTLTSPERAKEVEGEDGLALEMLMQRLRKTGAVYLNIEADDKNLRDLIFLESVDAVIRVPAGFVNDLRTNADVPAYNLRLGKENIKTFNLKQDLDLFFRLGATSLREGRSFEDWNHLASYELKVERVGSPVTGNHGRINYLIMTRMLPFYLLILVTQILGLTILELRRSSLQLRLRSTPCSVLRQTLETWLAQFMISMSLLLLFLVLIGLLVRGDRSLYFRLLPQLLLNGTALSFSLVGLSHLLGTLIRDPKIFAGAQNTLSLAFSMLSGVFIALEDLGDGIRALASCFPIYYYVLYNKELATDGGRTTYYLLIQFLFGFVYLLLAFLVDKMRQAGDITKFRELEA